MGLYSRQTLLVMWCVTQPIKSNINATVTAVTSGQRRSRSFLSWLCHQSQNLYQHLPSWSSLEGWQQKIQVGRGSGSISSETSLTGQTGRCKNGSHIYVKNCSYSFYYWAYSLYFGTEHKQKWIQTDRSTPNCIQTIRNVRKANLKCKSFGLNHFYVLQ